MTTVYTPITFSATSKRLRVSRARQNGFCDAAHMSVKVFCAHMKFRCTYATAHGMYGSARSIHIWQECDMLQQMRKWVPPVAI